MGNANPTDVEGRIDRVLEGSAGPASQTGEPSTVRVRGVFHGDHVERYFVTEGMKEVPVLSSLKEAAMLKRRVTDG